MNMSIDNTTKYLHRHDRCMNYENDTWKTVLLVVTCLSVGIVGNLYLIFYIQFQMRITYTQHVRFLFKTRVFADLSSCCVGLIWLMIYNLGSCYEVICSYILCSNVVFANLSIQGDILLLLINGAPRRRLSTLLHLKMFKLLPVVLIFILTSYISYVTIIHYGYYGEDEFVISTNNSTNESNFTSYEAFVNRINNLTNESDITTSYDAFNKSINNSTNQSNLFSYGVFELSSYGVFGIYQNTTSYEFGYPLICYVYIQVFIIMVLAKVLTIYRFQKYILKQCKRMRYFMDLKASDKSTINNIEEDQNFSYLDSDAQMCRTCAENVDKLKIPTYDLILKENIGIQDDMHLHFETTKSQGSLEKDMKQLQSKLYRLIMVYLLELLVFAVSVFPRMYLMDLVKNDNYLLLCEKNTTGYLGLSFYRGYLINSILNPFVFMIRFKIKPFTDWKRFCYNCLHK